MKPMKSFLALTFCGALALATQSCSQKNDENQLNSPDGTALTLDASTGLIKTAIPEWSSIGELSRISIANNSAPVEVPDFTRGAWKKLDRYHHYMKGE